MASWVARIAATALLLALAGCGSPQEKAAKAAARFDALYAQRDYDAARIEIRRAIAAEDDVPEYWAKLARVQLALGHYLDAYDAYGNVIDLDPGNRDAIQSMAEIAYSGQSYDDSEKFADQILADQPRSLRMLLVKGSIAAARRDLAKARAIAERILAIDPANEGGAILLARVQRMEGDPLAAIATLEASVARDGESVPKRMALLDLYTGRDDFRKAAFTFARLFMLKPDDLDLRLDYVKLLYGQGLPDRALAMLARLTRRHPGNVALEQRIVDLWAEAGAAAVDVERVRRFVSADGDQTMKVALAHLLLDQKRHAEAEAVLRPYVDRDRISPANVEADIRYADALAGLGRWAEARALIDRVLAFDANNPRALLTRVDMSMRRGDLAQALRDAQLLVRDNPGLTAGRIALARIYVRRNERILADNAYGSAMNELSDHADMLAAYIAYQHGRGRDALALDAARRFTRENPQSRDGWRQRAELCMRLADADCVAASLDALDQVAGGPRLRRAIEAAAAGQAPAICGRTGGPC
jgi:tetratricopeptide (TPR) repeat protein